MARGFESKDVEFQQAEASREPARGKALTPEERAAADERRTLELSLARATADRLAARSPAHRVMLDRAIAELQERLSRL